MVALTNADLSQNGYGWLWTSNGTVCAAPNDVAPLGAGKLQNIQEHGTINVGCQTWSPVHAGNVGMTYTLVLCFICFV